MKNPSTDRILHILKSRGAQTSGTLGDALGMTKAGAQQNLAKLAARDLVASEDRISGRGRPQRYWTLTDKGHARFPDRHSDLTLDLLTSTEAVFGAEGLDRLIRHREETTLAAYNREMAGLKTLPEKIAALVAIRSREGYMAEWQELDGSFIFMENHCPVCAAAAFCQGLCRSELEIFRTVLGPDVRVERTDHILAGARRCAYEIRPES